VSVASRFLANVMKLPPAESRAIKVERDLKIPMPDGVVLLADRYIPASGEGPLVLIRCPYGRKNTFGTLFGTVFAERGLQVLLQSCRGTFGSGGQLDAFDEGDDGLATIAWMREQSWYPGSFAMAGPSYLGIVQWAVAAKAGGELKALALLVTSTDPYDLIHTGGSFSLETTLTWVNLVEHQERRFALVRQGPASRKLKALYGNLPLGDLDSQAVGHQLSDWQAWMSHPEADDPYWTPRRFTDSRAEVGAPASFVAGWQDIFLPTELRDYAALRAAGHEPYLLIGPWQHTDQEGMAASVKESIVWLRAQLLDDKSQLRTSPVRIYVGGIEEWRDLPSWPPAAAPQRWHLQPDGGLDIAVPAAAEPDAYTYDPADPTPSVGGPVLSGSPERRKPPSDNRELEARPDVLTYTSSPLQSDLEVIGQVSAELFVKSSLEHTDFFARLCDVDSSGKSTAVCDALLRLSPGRPAAGPDGTILAAIDLWPTAYRFKSGHRIRLQVSSGAHPRYARNPGSGEPLATATKLVPADQLLYHDPDHPSVLVLPVTGGS
jgi:putative CocE/NonD family hydrolase